jgi:aerobic-type carbon monoxide dehydrogenase small subunit (CoxS/CutS family)
MVLFYLIFTISALPNVVYKNAASKINEEHRADVREVLSSNLSRDTGYRV